MSGCKDNSFLDLKDPDAFDDTKFYRDSADMNGLLSASYASLRGAFDKMFFVTEMKSDNATTNDVGSSGGLYYNFVNHTVSSSNTIVAEIYNNLYFCIHRANLVLEHVDAVQMTDAERRNMEMNTQALRMAHAVERNPEQLAAYKELHEAHKRNPQGYKKLYPNLFGFLVATFRMQLEAEQAKTESEKTPAINEAVAENRVPIIGSHKPKTKNHVTYNPFRYETNLPIHLCRARCMQPVGARPVRARSA